MRPSSGPRELKECQRSPRSTRWKAPRAGAAMTALLCREACPGENPGSKDVLYVLVAVAALLAAHLALIAAASCSRRSGVRLSFLFCTWAFNAAGCFSWVRAETLEVLPDFLAGAVDLLLVLAAAAPSFCFSLASFFAPFCWRASSRRIFFLRLLSLFIWMKRCSADR